MCDEQGFWKGQKAFEIHQLVSGSGSWLRVYDPQSLEATEEASIGSGHVGSESVMSEKQSLGRLMLDQGVELTV